MRKCRHPHKYLEVKKYHWTDHHPYGEDDHTDHRFTCTKCGKWVDIGLGYYIAKESYEKLTGRSLDEIKEMKMLFKNNNGLFNQIGGMHPELVGMVKSNPKLEKAIERKRNLIEKHQDELEYLESMYESGEIY